MKTRLESMIGLLSGRCSEEELASLKAELDDPDSGPSRFLRGCGIAADRALGEGRPGERGLSPGPAMPAAIPLNRTPQEPAATSDTRRGRRISERARRWGLAAAAALVLISGLAWWGSEAEKAELQEQLAEEREQRRDLEEQLAATGGQGGFPAVAPLDPRQGGRPPAPGIGGGQPRFGGSRLGPGKGQPRPDGMPLPDRSYGTWQYYSDEQLDRLKRWILRQEDRSDAEKQFAIQWSEQANNNTKYWISWWDNYYRTKGYPPTQPR
jgi:hypothetical protein